MHNPRFTRIQQFRRYTPDEFASWTAANDLTSAAVRAARPCEHCPAWWWQEQAVQGLCNRDSAGPEDNGEKEKARQDGVYDRRAHYLGSPTSSTRRIRRSRMTPTSPSKTKPPRSLALLRSRPALHRCHGRRSAGPRKC